MSLSKEAQEQMLEMRDQCYELAGELVTYPDEGTIKAISDRLSTIATMLEAGAAAIERERYQWLTSQQDVYWQTHQGEHKGGGCGPDTDYMIDYAMNAEAAISESKQ